MMNNRVSISPKAVARSFSTAAATYDEHAQLQRDVVDALIKLIKAKAVSPAPRRILNFGSGTGYCCEQLETEFPDSEIVNLDIAEGMLHFHADLTDRSDTEFVCGDVSSLPFISNSFDFVFSSLALQWCADTATVFKELGRVCSPSGRMFISTLGPETLNEVRLLWQGIDDNRHVNDFPDKSFLQSAASRAGLEMLEITGEIYIRKYLSLREMARELKGLGANNKNPDMPRGLTGRNKLRMLEQRFDDSCKKGWFRSGFNVFLLHLRVPE